MGDLFTSTESTSHHETARHFLRIATEQIDLAGGDVSNAVRVRNHLIGRANAHGLSWIDIAQETGLSVQECMEATGVRL